MSIIKAYYSGFTNYESGDYSISQWKTEDIAGLPEALRNGTKKRSKVVFSVKGYHVKRLEGVLCELHGEWTVNAKGMTALDVKMLIPVKPADGERRITYLSSGLIQGIGRKQAIAIEREFGADIFRVLDEAPELLLSIPGIGITRLEKIKKSYSQVRFTQELYELLGNEEISPQATLKIKQELGENAIEKIRKNPYILSTIAKLPFPLVDGIALKLQVALESIERVEAAALYIFDGQRTNGHLYLLKDYLLQEVEKLLNQNMKNKLTPQRILELMEKVITTGDFEREKNERIYPVYYAQIEEDTAQKLTAMNQSPIEYEPAAYTEAMNSFLKNIPILLSKMQDRAIRFSLTRRVVIITGGPGTGKTTIVNGIIQIYKMVNLRKKVFLLAPTGRAARRVSETTGEPAYTIDKMIYMLTADESKKLLRDFQNGLVICDEMSMVDSVKMWMLTNYFTEASHFVMVGDADQLPSVGPGEVLRQLIESRCILTIKLDLVYRQGKDSTIYLNAHKINQGETDLIYDDEFRLIKADSELQARDIMKNLYFRLVSQYGYENVSLLTPRRRNSVIGSNDLNRSILSAIGVKGAAKIHANGLDFHVGDRIMETQNNEKANNGDIGTITAILPYKEDDRLRYKAEIQLDGSDEVVTYTQEDMATLVHGYCITIHKSQGSEYSYVIIPVMESHKRMLKRNLLYTAVTRAKKGLILVGQPEMIEYAINSIDTGVRNTMLAEFMCREKQKLSEITEKKGA